MRGSLRPLILAALAACRGGDRLPPGVDALVTTRQVTVAFPLEASDVGSPTDSTPGAFRGSYNWKFGVTGPTGFVAILSIGHEALPTPAQLRSLESRVRAASLRVCDPPDGHMIVCRRQLDGEGRVIKGRVVVVVRDTALVQRLLRHRPAYLWRSPQFPESPFVRDTVAVTYGT